MTAVFALAGTGHYLVNRRRRELARRNLRRVCRWLVEHDLGTAGTGAATRDPRALERLVRDAFRHHARYYLEVLRTPALSAGYVAAHLSIDDQAGMSEVFDARRPDRGVLFVGMHFGAMELPARYAVVHTGRPALVPMETVADPALQAWFERQRGAVGVELVDPLGAGRRLIERARQGGVVAVVGDRDVLGGGRPTELFGALARLPVGPALVAIEAGVPAWVAAARRTGPGTYAARIVPIAAPPAGQLKARVVGFMAAQARAFERLVTEAPEQWWTLLFPIWEDEP